MYEKETRPVVGVRLLRTDAVLPQRAHPGDAGFDVCAAVEVTLAPGETRAIPTGLALDIPAGYEVQVRPRSGLSLRTPLRIANSPGTIDHGFRDELCVILHNTSCRCMMTAADAVYTLEEQDHRAGSYRIAAGARIAQLVVARLPELELVPVDPDAPAGYDRGGGFGSTGL